MTCGHELLALKDQIELFLWAHPEAILHDARAGWLSLKNHQFSLEIQYGKLYLTLWNQDRTMTRRIEKVRWSENERLVLDVSSGMTRRFELQIEARSGELAPKKNARKAFCPEMKRILQRCFPNLQVGTLLSSKDLSRSFSECYARGQGIEHGIGWALFGVHFAEDQATIDASLSFALIWLNHLRARAVHETVAGLRLVLPAGRSATVLSRVAFLRSPELPLDVVEYEEGFNEFRLADAGDIGNVATSLSQVDRVPLPLAEIPTQFLPPSICSRLGVLEIVHRPASRLFSVRFHGLEFAKLAEDGTHRFSFGVGGEDNLYLPGREDQLESLIENLVQIRKQGTPDASHPFFKLQSERWLESLVLADIEQIDFELDPNFVYPQVPAFSGLDRGVIDVLTLTKTRRLAVLELKVSEDIHLPLQALDYWTRVKWHQDRGDFNRQGYFSGVEVSPAPPRLFLISPAFRFHSTTEGIVQYFPKNLEVTKVAVNENWRAGIQVLYRRKM